MAETYGMKVGLDFVPDNLDKILKQVENTFDDVKVGFSSGAKTLEKQTAGFAGGITSGALGGTGGVGQMVGQLAVISGALFAISAGIETITKSAKQVVNFLAESSPYLKGVNDYFGRAFNLFFRPFGDALATILKPWAFWSMKMAIDWLGWTRSKEGQAVVGGVTTGGVMGASSLLGPLGAGGGFVITLPTHLKNIENGFDEFSGLVENLTGKDIETHLTEFVDWVTITLPNDIKEGWNTFTEWLSPYLTDLSGKVSGAWNDINTSFKDISDKIGNVPSWIEEEINTSLGDLSSFGTWLFNEVTGKIKQDTGQLTTFGSWVFNTLVASVSNIFWELWGFAGWLYDSITSGLSNVYSKMSGVGIYLYEEVTKSISDAFSNFSFAWSWGWEKSYASGSHSVPATGPYLLHRGEQVIPNARASRTSNTKIVTNFNINAQISSAVDLGSSTRMAARSLEREFRKRGVVV